MGEEQRELWATAYHEAGHALACWALGLPFERVTINRTNGCRGWIEMPFPQSRDQYRPYLAAVFAGSIGEEYYTRQATNPSETDRIAMDAVAARLDHGLALAMRLDARQDAATLLRNLANRAGLRALASALMERRTLTRAEANAAIEGGITQYRAGQRMGKW